MNTVDISCTKKEMKRTVRSIERIIKKKLSKYHETTFIFAVGYMSESNHAYTSSWNILSDAPVLEEKMHQWIPAMDAALNPADDIPRHHGGRSHHRMPNNVLL